MFVSVAREGRCHGQACIRVAPVQQKAGVFDVLLQLVQGVEERHRDVVELYKSLDFFGRFVVGARPVAGARETHCGI